MKIFKASVLIVDDDSDMTETLSDILREMDYLAQTANDGEAAVRKVADNGFQIALMDIKMPGMDGVEVCKRIKKIQPGINVIMMTAYSSDRLVDEAVKVGAREVLKKPLEIGNVLAILGEIAKEGF